MNISPEAREAAASVGANGINFAHWLGGEADWHPLAIAMQTLIDQTIERCAVVADNRMPVVQCMSVEPVVEACQDIACGIRSLKSNTDGGGDA